MAAKGKAFPEGVDSMNLEFFKNFIAIVEAGGLNKASRRIHVAQPALTRQLQIMEKEYGVPLVDPRRGRHSLKLTEAGWIFYRQAKQICEVDRMTRAEIESLSTGLKGTLRISMTPAYSPFLISRLFPAFHKKYPDVSIRIRESYYMELIQDVRQGISELGISNAPIPDPSFFEFLKTVPEILMVAGPRGDSFLENRKTVKAKDLLEKRICVSRSTEEMTKQIFRTEGKEPILFAEVGTRYSAVSFAAQGMAYSLVLWNENEPVPEGIILRPVETDIQTAVTYFTLKNHTFTKAMEIFVDKFVLEKD